VALYLFIFNLFVQFFLFLLGILRFKKINQPLFKKTCFGFIIAGTLLVVIYAFYQANYNFVVKKISVPTLNLPKGARGIKIVHVSDLHIGALFGHTKLVKMKNIINKLEPDIVFITGDLVDEDPKKLKGEFSVLKEIKSKFGIYAVTGNHEYYAGVDDVVSLAKDAGVVYLRNKKIKINKDIVIYGVDDPTAKRFGPLENMEIEKVLDDDVRKNFSIFLYHQPKEFEKVASLGIKLMLSGHTHKGQLWPFSLISKIFYPYQYGLYNIGESFLYVTSGVGTWGPPMRVLSESEIVLIRNCSVSECKEIHVPGLW